MQVERNVCHLLEAVAPSATQLLQIVDEHDPMPPGKCSGQDVLHAPPRGGHQLELRGGDFLLPFHNAAPLFLGHLAPVDPAEVDDAAVRHQAVGELRGAGFEAVKADFVVLPHERRHLQRQRGLARGRPPGNDHKVAVIRVQAAIQLVKAPADKSALFALLGVELHERLLHRHDLRGAFLAQDLARLSQQVAPLCAGAHVCHLRRQFPQPCHARLLLHGRYVGAPAERGRRDLHALHEQVVILRAAHPPNGHRVHRSPSTEQLDRGVVYRAQLGDGEILRPGQAD